MLPHATISKCPSIDFVNQQNGSPVCEAKWKGQRAKVYRKFYRLDVYLTFVSCFLFIYGIFYNAIIHAENKIPNARMTTLL